ncbi:SDR family NAD(P)-dependent oxidoreductase [Nonomuraea sp. NPDC026600]|uniref:SDR family NAD(P)-dependent oxidoreductase n=1 Tax=Nonomuraea sp. NPDC026600 TaxID=3155363 RepID=UPI0033F7E593
MALITGGSKGTGLGIAKAYVKEGVAVAITGRDADALAQAKAELEALVPDARVLALTADNKDHEAAARVVSQAVEDDHDAVGRRSISGSAATIGNPQDDERPAIRGRHHEEESCKHREP